MERRKIKRALKLLWIYRGKELIKKNEAIIIIYYLSSFTTYWTHYTTFVIYYQERNYSTIPFKSRNVHIDFQILPLLLPCSMIPSGTLREHMEPLHFTLTNNVYFPKVSLTLSIVYQWTRNIDLIIFLRILNMEKTILHKCSETKLLSLVLFLLQFEFISVVMNIFSDIFSHNCFLLLLRNVVSSSFHTWCIITVLLCLESQDTEELFIYLKWIFRQFLNCTSTESVDLFFISS